MQIKTGVGIAIGKIILMGEHSVVYGEPAIAIPFPTTKIKTTIDRIDGDAILCCYFYNGILSNAPEQLLGITTIIKGIVEELSQELKDISIRIESTIPPERGMGSSAAVAIATTRALYDYFEQTLTNEKLLKWADISERIVHGNPSGIDAAIVSGETPLYFIRKKSFEPFTINLNGYLIVADSGQLGNTRAAVMGVKEYIESNPEEGVVLIKELGKLANDARASIELNDISRLGYCMSQAHEILDRLGVSNQDLNQLVTLSLSSGALGAKLTGGGRGGCIIALAKDKESAEFISHKLLFNGAKNTWICYLGDDIV